MNEGSTTTTDDSLNGKATAAHVHPIVRQCPGCGRVAELEWSNAADIGKLYCSRGCAIRNYWTTDIHKSLRLINEALDRHE